MLLFILFVFFIVNCSSSCYSLNLHNNNRLKFRNIITSTVISSTIIFSPILSSYAGTGMITGGSLTKSESAITDALEAAVKSNQQKSYSNNAKNLERMSQGDYSMGSKQTSTSERSKKRIAVAACKNGQFRSFTKVSEKECNNKVFDNDYAWVLDGLEKMEAKNKKK